MKTEFTPIAMRCTKEQFKAIEPKLNTVDKLYCKFTFGEEYLTNNFGNIDLKIGTTFESDKNSNNRKVYEAWDEATFLKACGIEVDTYTVSKHFILEAHESACSTWKTKIENHFPDLFPKVELELNKWYKNGDKGSEKSIACVVEVNPNPNPNGGYNAEDFKGYGFDLNGKFHPFKDCFDWGSNNWIKATKEEVETALIAEAKKRGYSSNMIIKDGESIRTIGKYGSYYYNPNINMLHYKGVTLFNNGKWAEIISEPIELSLDEIAEKFGVDVSLIKIKK